LYFDLKNSVISFRLSGLERAVITPTNSSGGAVVEQWWSSGGAVAEQKKL